MQKPIEIEIVELPFTLNEMVGAGSMKAQGAKRKYYKLLEEALKELIVELKADRIEKGKANKYHIYRFKTPLFTKPFIEWQIHYVKSWYRRDRKNLIGGLKWLEDCLVNMNIIHDDSIFDFSGEKYKIVTPSDENKIVIKLKEVKNGRTGTRTKYRCFRAKAKTERGSRKKIAKAKAKQQQKTKRPKRKIKTKSKLPSKTRKS